MEKEKDTAATRTSETTSSTSSSTSTTPLENSDTHDETTSSSSSPILKGAYLPPSIRDPAKAHQPLLHSKTLEIKTELLSRSPEPVFTPDANKNEIVFPTVAGKPVARQLFFGNSKSSTDMADVSGDVVKLSSTNNNKSKSNNSTGATAGDENWEAHFVPPALSKPLIVDNLASHSLAVSWSVPDDDSASEITGYNIEMSENGSSKCFFFYKKTSLLFISFYF